MHRFLFALSTLALLACTHPRETPDVKVSPPLSGEGKPTAPVELTTELTPTHARLSIHFEAEAQQATLTVSGLDGLTVGAVSPGGEHDYKQGQNAQVDVDYSGTGTLVVNVSGTFNGARRSRVLTFAVGGITPAQAGTRVTPDNGVPFKALPSTP
jgi:hypothetical protein